MTLVLSEGSGAGPAFKVLFLMYWVDLLLMYGLNKQNTK